MMISNTQLGRDFQQLARDVLQERLAVTFELDTGLLIGNPPRSHRFDLVSRDHRIIGEAKAFTWTKSENVPSAKVTGLREAAQYLNLLDGNLVRFIVMKRSAGFCTVTTSGIGAATKTTARTANPRRSPSLFNAPQLTYSRRDGR
jgi:hypothetical protein